jgi:hypothetical protein
VIISASYKTDIPTFYGDWFMQRLRAGFCKMVNPYSRKISRVELRQLAVDGFIFWTKNPGPFLKHLPEVQERGYPFIVQYTINGYPREIETSVVDASQSVAHASALREMFGPHVMVWRYDTILFSSLTPREFHVENFGRLARALSGTADEVVVSFAQLYKKTKRNLEAAAQENGFTWSNPPLKEKRELIRELAAIARTYGFQLSVCSQRDLIVPDARDARCVDARRLELIGGNQIKAELKGNRPECGCFASRDIGEYDTCPHGCVYCYAVQNRRLALRRFRQHNPASEFLFEPPDAVESSETKKITLPLFRT